MIAVIDYEVGNLRSVQKAFEYLGGEAVITRDPDVVREASHVVLPGVGAFGDAMAQLVKVRMDRLVMETVEADKPFLGICLGMQLLFEGSDEGGWHSGLGLFPGRVTELPHKVKVPHMGWNNISAYRGENAGGCAGGGAADGENAAGRDAHGSSGTAASPGDSSRGDAGLGTHSNWGMTAPPDAGGKPGGANRGEGVTGQDANGSLAATASQDGAGRGDADLGTCGSSGTAAFSDAGGKPGDANRDADAVLFETPGVQPWVYFVHSFHRALPEVGDPGDWAAAVTEHGVPFISAVRRGCCLGVQFHPEKSGTVGLGMLKRFLALSGRRDSDSASARACLSRPFEMGGGRLC
jgi:imidazoleglycerol phosphate synthase glutamine amidotransferase subunit HisH